MYEIPQELQYTEKIMFGLTLKQTLIALVTFSLAYFTIFKWPANIWIKYSITGTELVLGVLFTFFNLDKFLRDFFAWLFKRKIPLTKQNVPTLFGIKNFENDSVIINGVRTSIIEILPMNFSIKNNDEQESTVKSFRKLLQAIDFPTQYFLKTEPLDISQYIDSLRIKVKDVVAITGNDNFVTQFKSLEEQLIKIINESKVSNRKFYIIIPEQSKKLEIQTKIIQDKIKSLGLRSKKLSKEQLELIINNFLNVENSELLLNREKYLQIGSKFCRTVAAFGYPRLVEPGFLDKIITLEGKFDLSIHINPKPISTMMVSLNRELQKQRSDLYGEQQKNIVNPSLEIKYSDTRKILEELQKGKDKLFDVSLYIQCRANSLEELDLLTQKVESELNSTLIIPEIPKFKQLQGLKSVAPISNNALKINRNITTTALSAFFPFTSKFLDIDFQGIWLGQNKNNIPIIKDIFSFSNPNGAILASSGAGKSYAAKLFISRYLLSGVKVIIIDPQGEYQDIVKKYNGQIIDLDTQSTTIINPLDLMEHSYEEKRLFLMDLMKVMLGTLTEPQKSIIDKAISQAYSKKGISDNHTTWDKVPPILEDVLHELKEMEKNINSLADPSIISLVNRLELYVFGVFKFLNQNTKIDFNNQLVCFNIHNLPSQVQPVLMFLILDYVFMKMKKDINRKILLIDESWKLLSRAEEASYVFSIVKTCRKFNMGLLLINQEVEGLLESSAGKSVLANSSYTLLLKQKPAVIKQLKTVFDLSDYEKDYLLTASIGEGILITEQEHNEIRVVASETEHELITTNPDEKLKKKNMEASKMEQSQSQKAEKIDFTKSAYGKENLTQEQINKLKDRKYIEFTSKVFGQRKTYFLKPRENELPLHLFTVCAITDHLRKQKIEVKVSSKGIPDIEINKNNKKYAIEIETGNNYFFNKKFLQKKFKDTQERYSGRLIVVVTNPLMKQYYESLASTFMIKGAEHAIKELLAK